MATIKKKIGLSLGADICWPLCYEEIIKNLKLSLPQGKDRCKFEVERLTIEPFNLSQPCKYDVVLDRLTHWYYPSREWIKKAILMNDLYVLNNPWTIQSMEKQTSYCAMMRLGMPIPDTWLIPPKSYDESADLEHTLKSYAKLFDLEEIGKTLGYPLFMKPYDGGGWRGVNRIEDGKMLLDTYEQSGKMLMHLQQGVNPFEAFVRCIGLGPQVNLVDYDPSAPLHGRYCEGEPKLDEEVKQLLRDITLVINAFFLWDFNSCEALLKDGVWHPIDFANPCPDSQVTSLHWHFPWVIKAKIRWSLFCAYTGRKAQMNPNWAPYFEIADGPGTFMEKLPKYTALANEHFQTEAFNDFCEKHLPHLDQVAWDFFGTNEAKKAVHAKVSALFPEHEIETFTDYFWDKIQLWRKETT